MHFHILRETLGAKESRDKGNTQQLSEEFIEERCGEHGCVLHPEFIEQLGKKYQVCFLRILPIIAPTPVNIDQNSLAIS